MGIGMNFWIIVFILIGIVVHALIGYYVDKLKIVNNDRLTNYSLIPFFNVFLLGKYVFNEFVGILLFVVLFFVAKFKYVFASKEYGFSILTNNARHLCFVLYFVIVVCIIFLASRKYNGDTKYKDRLSLEKLVYYLRESIWLAIFFIAIYLFILFVISAGTGVISFWYNFFFCIKLSKLFDL